MTEEQHVESISKFLLENGADIFNNEYFIPFYVDVPTMILAPTNVALQSLVTATSGESLDEILTSKEGIDILDNYVTTKPTNKTWPMITAVNGRQYGKSEIDIRTLNPRNMTAIRNVLLDGRVLSTSIVVVDSLILHDQQVDRLKQAFASTLNILVELFKVDPRLVRTKPTQEYRVDPAKWAKWQSLAAPELKGDVRYIQYHFDEWLTSFAKGIDQLLESMNYHQCDIYVSTGISEIKEQSSSELWMFYIFSQVMKAKGKRIEPYNEYWSILMRDKAPSKCKHLLLIDDFVRTGTHLTKRIVTTPDLLDYMAEKGAILYILTPIMVTPKIFQRTVFDVIIDVVDKADVDRVIQMINTQTKYLTGIYYDIEKYPYIVLDHNGSDKYESEISVGNLGNGFALGPLMEGDSVENPYRYPPPLYHLEFGNGTIPFKAIKLKPSRDGLYSIVF